jgi:hypothetical protein
MTENKETKFPNQENFHIKGEEDECNVEEAAVLYDVTEERI